MTLHNSHVISYAFYLILSGFLYGFDVTSCDHDTVSISYLVGFHMIFAYFLYDIVGFHVILHDLRREISFFRQCYVILLKEHLHRFLFRPERCIHHAQFNRILN